MKRKKAIALALSAVALMACQQTKENEATKTIYKPAFEIQDCDLTLGGIHFTKMINDADKQVTEKEGIIPVRSAPEIPHGDNGALQGALVPYAHE